MFSTRDHGPYAEIWRKTSFELRGLLGDFNLWLSRLNEGEKLLGLCLFILVLILLSSGQSDTRKPKSSLSFQFVMALSLVIMFGFGIGWITDPTTFRSLLTMS